MNEKLNSEINKRFALITILSFLPLIYGFLDLLVFKNLNFIVGLSMMISVPLIFVIGFYIWILPILKNPPEEINEQSD